LEGQLLKYHNENPQFKFLNTQNIKDYGELNKLFFQVLAQQVDKRSSLIQQKYSHIPYLNSSLFEISPLEDASIKINELDTSLDIDLYANSVLKRKRSKVKGPESANTLHYLLDFLEAYDFASMGKEEVQEENKTIINAAVLGLVFEKINGYRDGSIYTPGAITMYICRETIRKAVVQKFNETYKWKCETIADIKNHLSDRRNQKDILEFNSVIESIRIVDPAVGSGHFLVSSLNELIVIKAELGLLADAEGNRLSDIDVSIANDELVVTYHRTQTFFEYTVNTTISGSHIIAPEVQRIQQTLFDEKRKLIEGSLFGVDINPNSVKICQLRLWIELLKYTYYRADENYTQLETLPNIDINIKHGNSLLSKYSLTEDLTEVFKKQKFGVKDYRSAVHAYKEAHSKEAKAELQKFIKEIKSQFHETVSRRDPKRKRLADLRGQLILAQSNMDLFGKKRTEKEMELEVRRLKLNIEKIETEIKEVEENVIYRNAFEWRFEFPEVLDEKGNFEGFEVIIGNPPYIQLQKMGADADALQKGNYKTFERTGDIYCLFYEQAIRLLKSEYYWMRANYGITTRNFFLKETNPLLLVDFGGYQVFESATVDTNILISQKSAYIGATQTCLIDKGIGSLEKMSGFIRQMSSTCTFSLNNNWTILSLIEQQIKAKIDKIGTPLRQWNINIYRGVLTGYNEAFIIDGAKREELIAADPKSAEIIRPILRGRDIKRYSYDFADLWLINTHNGVKEKGIKPININDFPAIKKHLDQYYPELERRLDKGISSYNLRNCAYMDDFNRQKIIYPGIMRIAKSNLLNFPRFTLDTSSNFFFGNDCYFIVGEHMSYLWLILNSTLLGYLFRYYIYSFDETGFKIFTEYFQNIPLPSPTKEILDDVEGFMKKTIDINEINNWVYKLIGFDDNEVLEIENAVYQIIN
jgi:adenine-specific DNA-methyltransferase